MTIPDSPALDLDALTALEQAATPAPWEAHMVQPNMAGNHQWYLHPVPRRPAGVHATGRGEDIDLIVAMRNQLPALLSALTAARAERDHYLRSFKAQQEENDRVHGKVREQYDVIEHAKRQRDEAIEQAKQAQAERCRSCDHLASFHGEEGCRYTVTNGTLNANLVCPCALQAWQWEHVAPKDRVMRLLDVTPAAAPQADEPKPTVCPAEYTRPGGRQRGDRIVRCHLPYGHPGEHEEAETECTWLDAAPDPATIRTALGDDWSGLLNDDAAPDPADTERARCPFCCRSNDGRAIPIVGGEYVIHLTGAGGRCSGSLKSLAALPPLNAEPVPAGGETTTPATRCCPNHREPGEARYGCATAPGVTDPCCNECHYWVAWTRYLDGHDDEDAEPVAAGGEDGSGTADGGVPA